MQKMSFLLLLVGLAACGCTSSSSYEDLERRNQLLRIENDNLKYELEGSQRDRERAATELAHAERKAAEREHATEEAQRDLAAARNRADQAEATVAVLKSKLEVVRQFLANGRITNKKERARVLLDLPAPASGPEASAAVTH